jgi:hypothetical protein
MKRNLSLFVCLSLLAAMVGGLYTFRMEKPAVAAEIGDVIHANERPMGHMVFFTLKERTPEHRRQLAELCKKYLADHPGTLYFSAGTVAEEMDRDVNVRDFDVALHLVFKNKKSQDDYQVSPRHLKFIEEGKPLWEKVRVFDSYIQ